MTDPTAPVTPRTEAGRNLLAFIDRQAPSDANDHEEWVAEWYAWRNDIEHRTLAIEREAGSTDALRAALVEITRTVYAEDTPLDSPSYSALHLRCIEIARAALAASDAGPAGIDVEKLADFIRDKIESEPYQGLHPELASMGLAIAIRDEFLATPTAEDEG
jgi:hypothetical protein